MFVVEINDLDLILLIDEVRLSRGQNAAGPHLVDAEAHVLPAVHSHEHNLLLPTLDESD